MSCATPTHNADGAGATGGDRGMQQKPSGEHSAVAVQQSVFVEGATAGAVAQATGPVEALCEPSLTAIGGRGVSEVRDGS